DETALLPYRSMGDSISDFTGAFTIGSPSARFAPIWDPQSCRLVGVINVQDSTSAPVYSLLASGLGLTSSLSGANGEPVYFGMRLVQGRPEFLYTHGSHAVAELIWLEDEGSVMKQKISFREPLKKIQLTIPPPWKKIITPSQGEWDANTLIAEGDSIDEITLMYQLDAVSEQIPEKEKSE
ncbi:MAG: hypothetical protein AAF357_13285, partial [Verrucomicrobiota bacterium]